MKKDTPMTEEMKIALQTAQALTDIQQPVTVKCNICRKEFTNNGNPSNMGMDLFMETLKQHLGLHGIYELNFNNVMDNFTAIPP